jgi:hypothetical protein
MVVIKEMSYPLEYLEEPTNNDCIFAKDLHKQWNDTFTNVIKKSIMLEVCESNEILKLKFTRGFFRHLHKQWNDTFTNVIKTSIMLEVCESNEILKLKFTRGFFRHLQHLDESLRYHIS